MFHLINGFAYFINRLKGEAKVYKILLCVVFACQPMIGFFYLLFINSIKKAHIIL